MTLYPSLTSRLSNQHELLTELIADIPETHVSAELVKGKWSIHDNIAHLARYQPVFLDRMHTILSVDEPSFERYVAEEDPDFPTWQKWDTKYLLERMNEDRKTISGLIISLSEEKLSRVGIHKKFGRLMIVKWTEFFLLHEAHHAFTIFQLAQSPAGML